MASLLRVFPLLRRRGTLSATTTTTTRSMFRGSGVRFGLEEFYDSRNRDRCREDPIAGRGWEASELRRKSFVDLHKLWYVLLKERNVLLTETQRARRFNMRIKAPERKTAVRKSMARIKLVLSERRAAYRASIKKEDEDEDDEEGTAAV